MADREEAGGAVPDGGASPVTLGGQSRRARIDLWAKKGPKEAMGGVFGACASETSHKANRCVSQGPAPARAGAGQATEAGQELACGSDGRIVAVGAVVRKEHHRATTCRVELQALQSVQHENIVALAGACCESLCLYLPRYDLDLCALPSWLGGRTSTATSWPHRSSARSLRVTEPASCTVT